MLLPRLLVFGGDFLILLAGSEDGVSCALAAACCGGPATFAPAAGCLATSPVLMVYFSALYLYGMHVFQCISRGEGFHQVGLGV